MLSGLTMRMGIALLLLALFCPAPALANQDASKDLTRVEQQLANSRKEQKQQETNARQAAKELEGARKNLTTLAAEIRDNESAIGALENNITAMTGEQQQLTVRLEADYGSIGNLVLALQRLRRTPPEAMIIRPGAPLQTAQTAMLLESILPSVSRRADSLAHDLQRLEDIRIALENDRARLETERVTLADKRKELDLLVKERARLHAQANTASTAAAARVKKLAAEANNLRDLMARLAEEQARQEQEAEAARLAAVRSAAGSTPSAPRPNDRMASAAAQTLPGLGKAQGPAAGAILIAYGEPDTIGAKAEGITIETAARALVVAPMGGIVRYSGPFKNYGNMIIIEHKKDYHSLLAGFDRLDVREGDSVNAGEPVGVLPRSSSRGGKPTLYYELRQKGRPVDPSHTVSGLRS